MSRRNRAEALAALNEAKSGKKRSEQFNLPETKNIYEEVNEEEYQQTRSKKRSTESWIDGPDKYGYADYGDEDIQDYGEYSDEETHADQKKKRKKHLKAKDEAKNPSKKIGQFFSAQRPSDEHQRPAKRAKIAPEKLDDDDFAAMLEQLDENPTPKTTEPQAKKKATPKTHISSAPSKSSSAPAETTDPSTKPQAALQKPQGTPQKPQAHVMMSPSKPSSASTLTTPKENLPVSQSSPLSAPSTALPSKASPAPKAITISKPSPDTWNKISSTSQGIQIPQPREKPEELTLPPLEKDGSLHMYWLDMHEDPISAPGRVYIFGKVWSPKDKKFVSCCIFVNGIERTLYLAPKLVSNEDGTEAWATANQMGEEFQKKKNKYNIPTFRAKMAKRNYAFDVPGVRHGVSDFMKVKYSYQEKAITEEADLSGEYYARIFGATTTASENLIIQKKLMGPCWLQFTNVTKHSESTAKKSWCFYEGSVATLRNFQILPFQQTQQKKTPLLSVMSLKVQCIMNHKTQKNEVVSVSVVTHKAVDSDSPTPNSDETESCTIVRKLGPGAAFPLLPEIQAKEKENNIKIQIESTERGLLGSLMTKIAALDPDVLCGHNFVGFDLDVLLHRMKELNIPYWSKLGRLNRTKMPILQAGAGGQGETTVAERSVTAGRLTCDTYKGAKEHVSSKDYKLSTLAKNRLGLDKEDVDIDAVVPMLSTASTLVDLCKMTEIDAHLALRLMFHLNLIPLTKQLTTTCGNTWSQSLDGNRAQRIEYLLMHKFYGHESKEVIENKKKMPNYQKWIKYVLPDRAAPKSRGTSKEKAKYGGGLVLEPKTGFYDDYIIYLDFNSLYPSLIQEYNICWSTVTRTRKAVAAGASEAEKWEDSSPPSPDTPTGVLPLCIKGLVSQRNAVRAELKKISENNTVLFSQLNTKQLALKLVANAMYGCLGFSSSRFFALPLARLITEKGRELLDATRELVGNKHNLETIYGDTDSIMLNSKTKDFNEAKQKARAAQKTVNQDMKYKALEIGIDGYFKTMLLLKKKKYAALQVENPDGPGPVKTRREVKGIDMVRRDWCSLSADISGEILNIVLDDGQTREEVTGKVQELLKEKAAQIRAGAIPLEKFVIRKGLSKTPESYGDQKTKLPHVAVALRFKRQGRQAQVGDFIEYCICKSNDPKLTVAQRAYSPDEIKKDMDNLQLDLDWYFSTQIHPPIARLCDTMEHLDSSSIAEHLGLNPNKFQVGGTSSDGFVASSRRTTQEKYKDVKKLSIQCPKCKKQSDFLGVYGERTNEKQFFGDLTCECQHKFSEGFLKNLIQTTVRQQLAEYYKGLATCAYCHHETNQVYIEKKKPRCVRGDCPGYVKLKYDPETLLTQLEYYRDLFDVPRALDTIYDNENQKAIHQAQLKLFLESERLFDRIQQFAAKIVEQNEYNVIPAKSLFSMFAPK